MDFSDAPQFGRRTGVCSVLEKIGMIDAPVIVESGTTRGFVDGGGGIYGDGWATLAWGWFCSKRNGSLYTVDVNPLAIDECRRLTSEFTSFVTYVCGDSVSFLSCFPEYIDLLYLDSADDPNVCLREFKAAENKLRSWSVVLIDDTDESNGKGVVTVPYMVNLGWKAKYIRNGNERQVFLILDGDGVS